ncbi:MAG: PspC domain-containing protein [Candidatus Acidiferrales bacterium]
MICYNCNQEILEGSRYCYHCGAAQKVATPSEPPAKPLRRSRKNKMIAGVCAGFAEYFGLDITLVRVIWLLVALFGGGGLLAYIVCWIIIPYGDAEAAAPVAVAH